MRLQHLVALPAIYLVAAEEQQPLMDKLKGYFNKITNIVPTAVPKVETATPLEAAAAKVANLAVTNLNISNWKDVLTPAKTKISGESHEWLVYITGNTTCHGLCDNTTKAWNMATTILSASPKAPHLATLDCDSAGLLCALWLVHPPTMYHMLVPSSGATPTVRYVQLNRTSASASDIAELHLKKAYEKTEPYQGYFHPFDGVLEKSGLGLPFAYVKHALSLLPPWAPMVIVTVFSRMMISRGMPQDRHRAPPVAEAAAAAAAAAEPEKN